MTQGRKSVARKLLEALCDHEGWVFGRTLIYTGAAHRGTIYVHLSRLEDDSLVRSRYRGEPDSLGNRRREYQITSKGRAALLRGDL